MNFGLLLAQMNQLVIGLASQRVNIHMAQKPHVVAVLQHLDRRRILPRKLPLIQLNGPHILLHPVLALNLLLSLQLSRNHRRRHRQRDQHQRDHHHHSQQHEALFPRGSFSVLPAIELVTPVHRGREIHVKHKT